MAEFKQIIDDALDILKFDGAVNLTEPYRTLWRNCEKNGARRSRRCWMNALMPLAFSI